MDFMLFVLLVDFCVSAGPLRKKCQSGTRCARYVLGETPAKDKEEREQEPSDYKEDLTPVKGGTK